ncbi:TIGR01244 family sulfur transferase [Rhodanobacter sp. C03]|uniref:TIGR01244 family sulfur transferase n=1 Tax=Rhodanobacter sp. C03 TaxID=1945858 RepID=UPI000987C5CE|nr:TIGR01244 family sulfur transferase [Rhodanobacter sp. C03]OOG59302.1 TIGR01244 family protein [Rhodanobacter sp. C03]
MHPKSLTNSISVDAQIGADDMAALAELGFRSVINNRPDGEADDQPASAELAAAAARYSLAYRHVPVVSGQIIDADVDAFAQTLATMPPPVLAFCRTGTRSTMLWSLQASRSQSVEDIVRIAAAAGYDLDGLRPRLQVQHDRYAARAKSG